MQMMLNEIDETTDVTWDKALASLPALGTLSSYISAAYRIPILDRDEEVRLFKLSRDGDDSDVIARLVLPHLRLVVSIARSYRGYGLPEDDLIQAGNIGLLKAVRGFEPENGARLNTYALQWIHSEMRDFVIRNCRIMKTATTKPQRKLFFNMRAMKSGFKQIEMHKDQPDASQSHRESLTKEQISKVAKILNVCEKDVTEMEQRLMGGDSPLNADSDDGMVYEFLGSTQYEPTQVMENKARDHMSQAGVDLALESLDARSRRIVTERWLNVDDNGLGMTLIELGKEMGVSAERIRQIEAKALVKMREHMSANTSMVC